MKKHHKPYSAKKTILFGLAIAAFFTAVSVFFLIMQARNSFHRLAGQITMVAEDSLDILDVRGITTHLIVPPDAVLLDLDSLSDLSVGQHVMTRGEFIGEKLFEVDGLRVIQGPDLK